ncbi:MAG: HAMP domain-containing histidine kinase [Burkholderiales bacterium]|nr:HAMP domain-containing histidine kinase [Burkholderiales bacterium]
MTVQPSFTTRLTWVLALLLLAYGSFVALLGKHLAGEQEAESLQRLSRGLALHIVEHWPEIAGAERAARDALLDMLMTVNPGVQVYVLDASGRVRHYLGDPGMVQQHQVDLDAVRTFLDGGMLPLRGTDPMGSGVPRIFSAAAFPPQPGQNGPPGYLYVVLDGRAREQVAGQIGPQRLWQGAALAALGGLVVTMAVGIFTFRRLTLPLHRLASRMRDYQRRSTGSTGTLQRQPRPPHAAAAAGGDEVGAIDEAFVEMTQRIESQAAREERQVAAHREMMASVAHDLRTPLTALHGHLEALAGGANDGERRARVLQAALSQSRKVSRLSQQLFELAALQSSSQVLHRERFRLDELVTDAVQKFELADDSPSVTLSGAPPGRLELDGDLHLIERALTNLIDNAVRHAPGPVHVSVRREGSQAEIVVEDAGPGLPGELHARLDRGASLRDPPIKRASGGIGGLGLAIAQRVAVLHGGSLRPLPAPQGGTRLCLALPLAP